MRMPGIEPAMQRTRRWKAVGQELLGHLRRRDVVRAAAIDDDMPVLVERPSAGPARNVVQQRARNRRFELLGRDAARIDDERIVPALDQRLQFSMAMRSMASVARWRRRSTYL
jgi:hypothetical protein